MPRPGGRLPLRQELHKLGADATSPLVRTSSESTEAALMPLEHHGAVRRRVAIVCVGSSGSAMASAALGLDQEGINVLDRAEFRLHVPRASRADAEQRVVSAGLTPIAPRRMLSRSC